MGQKDTLESGLSRNAAGFMWVGLLVYLYGGIVAGKASQHSLPSGNATFSC